MISSTGRIAGFAASLVIGLTAGPAKAQSGGTASHPVYRDAMKCFFANALAAESRTKAGDTARADVFAANAEQSFGVTQILGRALGLTDATIKADIIRAQASELPRMMTEAGYFKAAVATCKALKLM